jgi:methionyl-tRNA formyltransferase
LKIKLGIFANGERGLSCIEYLKKKKNYTLSLIIVKKKNDVLYKKLKKLKLSVLKSKNINSLKEIAQIKKLNLDFLLVCGYPDILKEKIIKLPKYCILNLHAGSTKDYRGGSPLNWHLINDEKFIQISVIKMNKLIDGGMLVDKKKIPISKKDYISNLHSKVNKTFPYLLESSIKKIIKKKKIKKINIKKTTYWHQRDDRDGKIDFKTMNSEGIHNLIRALSKPYNGAWALINKKHKIRFFRSTKSKNKIRGNPGKIVFIKEYGMCLICKDKALIIEEFATNYNRKLNGLILT